MGTNLTSFGGTIHAGSYGVVTLHGSHTLERGVRFERLSVRGSVHASEYLGGQVVCEAGTIRCDGVMRVDSLVGDGRIQLRGSIQCASMDFVGVLDGHGAVVCEGTMLLAGVLSTRQAVRAARLEVNGVLNVHTVQARHLQLGPFESALFPRHGITRYSQFSEATRIIGSSIHVDRLRCDLIRGDEIVIGKDCRIDRIVYRQDFQTGSSSAVTRIDYEYPASHRGRRVA